MAGHPIKPKVFVCDSYFVIAIVKDIEATELVENLARKRFKFLVPSIVIFESLKRGADGVLNLIDKNIFIESFGEPPLCKKYLRQMKGLSDSCDNGEIQTMLIARSMIDTGKKVIPIIDENTAHDYWEKYLGNGKPVYRTGRFIVDACKNWRVIDKGKAADYVIKLPRYETGVKKILVRQLLGSKRANDLFP